MAQFQERLKYLRKECNTQQKDIAAYIGVQPRTFRSYESGDLYPSFQVLIALADYFQVSIDYLTARSDDPMILSSSNNQKEKIETDVFAMREPVSDELQTGEDSSSFDSEANLYRIIDVYRMADEQKRKAIVQAIIGATCEEAAAREVV